MIGIEEFAQKFGRSTGQTVGRWGRGEAIK
jgi:hypothetical protein